MSNSFSQVIQKRRSFLSFATLCKTYSKVERGTIGGFREWNGCRMGIVTNTIFLEKKLKVLHCVGGGCSLMGRVWFFT